MFTISAKSLRAALHCSAAKDVRYYLQGVCIERHADDPRLYVISTDGHLMFVSRQDCEFAEDAPATFSIILPNDAVKNAVRSWGKFLPHIPLNKLSEGRYLLGEIACTPIDGIFPAWQRASPEKTTGETAQFNPQLLATAHDALADWHERGKGKDCPVYLAHNANGAAVMSGSDPDAFVVIMPWHSLDPPESCGTFKPGPLPTVETGPVAQAA